MRAYQLMTGPIAQATAPRWGRAALCALLIGLAGCTAAPATSTTGPSTAAASTATSTAGAPATPGPATPDLARLVPGLRRITVTQDTQSGLVGRLPAAPDPVVQVYADDDTIDALVDQLDAALTGAGYAFATPGQHRPVISGTTARGVYRRDGAPDVLLYIYGTATEPGESGGGRNILGLGPDRSKQLIDAAQGARNLLIVETAPGLVEALYGGGGATATPRRR